MKDKTSVGDMARNIMWFLFFVLSCTELILLAHAETWFELVKRSLLLMAYVWASIKYNK